ncbi:cytochrome P450 [Streptomyces shenzhenensis]
MTDLHELVTLRNGFDIDPGVRSRPDCGEVYRVRSPLGYEATFFSRYDDVRADGVDDKEMKQRRAGRLLMLDPPEHTRLRLLTATFTLRRIQAPGPRAQEIVDEHLDAMEAAGPPVDLVSAFALPMPSLVFCELLGVPFTDRVEFGARSNRFFDTAMSPQERLRLDAEADAYMHTLELVGLADLLLMFALVRDDPSTVEDAVEEVSRSTSVLHAGFVRVAVQDTIIGGRLVRRGEHMVTSLLAANHDPALLDGGEDLDVTRGRCSHVAFGHGIHHCLGATLARLELQLALPALPGDHPERHPRSVDVNL